MDTIPHGLTDFLEWSPFLMVAFALGFFSGFVVELVSAQWVGSKWRMALISFEGKIDMQGKVESLRGARFGLVPTRQ